MKALIIDDEQLARELIREYLEDRSDIEIIGEARDGFEAMKMIRELEPELLFLDIQMPKINGFELLELLQSSPKVIFTTAYDSYAVQAFETSATDYLLKPFSKERFDRAIDKLLHQEDHSAHPIRENLHYAPDTRKRIVVKHDAGIEIIPTDQIDYLEAYDDYVKIHTAEKYYLKKKTLSFYEKELDSAFFIRVHRSFIINLNKLSRLEAYEKNSYRCILSKGQTIPVSRSVYPELKMRLGI
ncbi:MAG: response regulator transcription factor [Bacteroidetes bacterium]|nr:MAG: response regulator transcription factor [Bacteroidota bacterium]